MTNDTQTPEGRDHYRMSSHVNESKSSYYLPNLRCNKGDWDQQAKQAPPHCSSLTGVGYKMEQELTQMNVKTAAELRLISKESLVATFGDRTGTFLYLACRGVVSGDPEGLRTPCCKHLWAGCCCVLALQLPFLTGLAGLNAACCDHICHA